MQFVDLKSKLLDKINFIEKKISSSLDHKFKIVEHYFKHFDPKSRFKNYKSIKYIYNIDPVNRL